MKCMLEKNIETKLTNGVKKLGGAALKLLAPWFTGWPDRTVLMPRGRIWFVELKAPGKKAKGRQPIVHAWLRGLGFDVRVLNTPELVQDFLIEIAQ